MSKIVCEVCGTSYPEAATQCPICGSVRAADAPVVTQTIDEEQKPSTYQYVKGGRFSKSNVRKRNAQAAANSQQKPADKEKKNEKSEKKQSGNRGLIITIIVLILAILAVAGYIVVKFFLPAFNFGTTESTTGQVETLPPTEPDLSCTAISFDRPAEPLSAIGEQFALHVVTTPADTTDVVTYTSDNEAVATVDENGLITIVDFGDAVITVTCGDVMEVCEISAAQPFALDEGSILLEGVGSSQLIYTGDVDVSEITWRTDDDSVALIADGVVIAVGNGETTVYGEYNGEIVSCTVTCNTLEESVPSDETTETETQPVDPSSYTTPFTLHNLYGGSNSDVTMTVGTTFVLALKDAKYNTISGVTWSVEDGDCCKVTDGTVEAVSTGIATVVATFDGETYECTVRVY